MNQNPRTITTDEELRESIKKGIDKVANLVKKTLGARGRNISLPRPYGPPHISKDGVSVAREIILEDPLEDQFAQLIKSVASKTNEEAGDGTTTATLLAQAIISEGLKNVTAGANPMDLKRGIDMAVMAVVKDLEDQAVDVEQDSEQITQIATISANGDEEIGKFIGEAFSKVGKEGVIAVESSKTNDTHIEIVEGMEIESGLISPYFLTNPEKQIAEFENPYIYIADKKIQKLEQIQHILQYAMEQGRPLVFIANEVEGEALSTLIINATPPPKSGKSRYPFAAVNSPSFGEDRSLFLEDIATITGATVISETKGIDFEKAGPDTLGTCEKITLSRKLTTIIKGNGDKKEIKKRMEGIRLSIKGEKEQIKERMLTNRLAKLSGGVAILNVGAASEAEVKEKKDRIEDAINATRAASEEGIIVGGGVALIKALKRLKETVVSERADVQTGINIIYKAIQMPLKVIVLNGEGKPDVVINEILKKGGNMGYDVQNEVFVDMFKAGIIDPKKVTRIALENAASVAGLILTTEGALTEIKTPE